MNLAEADGMSKWLLALGLCMVLAGCSGGIATGGLPQLEQAGENTAVSAVQRLKPTGQVDLGKVLDKEKLTLLFFLADW